MYAQTHAYVMRNNHIDLQDLKLQTDRQTDKQTDRHLVEHLKELSTRLVYSADNSSSAKRERLKQ